MIILATVEGNLLPDGTNNLGLVAQLAIPVALAASCAFMLPVATPPNSIVFASNLVPIQQMVRAGIFINLISFLYILLLSVFYYPLVL